MTVDQAITKAYSEAKGKATPPASGTAKYNQLVVLADSLQKVWAAEPGVQWDSLYSRVSHGTIGAVSSIALDSTVNYIVKDESNPIYATSGSDRFDFKLVRPNQLYLNRYEGAVAQAGRNLIFQDAFDSDSSVYGWTLYVPSILNVGTLDDGADTIQVDDPMWLVFMMAAEFVRNDLVRQNQYPALVAYAQQSMLKMKEANEGAYEGVITNWEPMGVTWT